MGAYGPKLPQQRLAKRKARKEKQGVNIDRPKSTLQLCLRGSSCSSCKVERTR